MNTKFKFKVLFSFITSISILLFTEETFAKIPLKAFKGVTRCFKTDKKHYSPTLGEAALESGLIHNLRFYGNYTPSYKEDSSRDYIRDASRDDPVWNMIHILFPSAGGSLGTDTIAKSNFGRYVKEPKTVALLLNFSNTYRNEISQLKNPLDKNKHISSWKVIISRSLDNAPRLARRTSNALIDFIVDSIDCKESLFYPRHTTEQIISAFFCYKFNTQKDIWSLLENLDDSIVDKSFINKEGKDLDQYELWPIARQLAPYDMDNVLALATADTWFSATPYREGSSPLSNGNAMKYNRKNDQYIWHETFADCVEIAARHLMNLFLYNPDKKEFDLTNIKDYVIKNSPNNPYFKNFEAFYEQQPPSLSNAGDVRTRSLWNKVVGDLNDNPHDPIQVKYASDGDNNDIDPGFVNFISLFQKVFGLKIDSIPSGNFADKVEWLEKAFNELFKALNPMKSYLMNLDRLMEDGNEISGDLPIVVKSKEGKDEFSFTFMVEFGKHSKIYNLKNLRKSGNLPDFTSNLEIHPSVLKENTTEESLWLLSPSSELKANKVHIPLYHLFSKELSDNDSKINFLKMLDANFDSWKKNLIEPDIIALKKMLRNVLNDVSWEDETVTENISPFVLTLAQRPELKEIFFEGVKGIKLQKKKHVARLSEVKSNFKNLEYLLLNGLEKIILSEVSLKGLEKLKSLNLEGSRVKRIEGINLKNLENLNLRWAWDLKEISLKEVQKLKVLQLSYSSVKEVEVIGLKDLENIELLGTDNLENLSLEDLEGLKHLDLERSNVKALKGLNTLKKLETLNLRSTSNIEELSLEGLEKLKTLNIESSNIRKIKKLDTLKNLEKIDLSWTKRLKEITFDSLESLRILKLYNSMISVIHLKDLRSIEELDLRYLPELKRITFEGEFPLLKNIYFRNQKKFEEITELRDLKNIECAPEIYSTSIEKNHEDFNELTRKNFVAEYVPRHKMEVTLDESGIK